MENNKRSSAKEKIFAAAKSMMSSNGYKASTTKMIAREAGVNESTLFRNFTSKEDIFFQIIQSASKTVDTTIYTQILNDEKKTMEERIHQFGLAFYHEMLEQKDVFLINFMEAERDPAFSILLSDNIKTIVNLLEAKLQDSHREGKLGNGDHLVAALMYIQSLVGAFIVQNRMAVQFYPIDIEQLCKNGADILINGLRRDSV